jgi:hypothetical protein
MPGHGRSKNGVASLAYVPGILVLLPDEVKDVDGRDEPGHGEFPISADMLEPNGGLRVDARWRPAASYWHALLRPISAQQNRPAQQNPPAQQNR